MNTKIVLFVGGITVLLSALLWFTSTTPLFSEQTHKGWYVFSDRADSGNSQSSLNTEYTLSFAGTLKKGFEYPYCGFAYAPTTASLNLKGSDRLVVTLVGPANSEMAMYLKRFIPGVSKKGESITLQPLMAILTPIPGKNTYSIAVSEFSTPLWWYELARVSRQQVPPTGVYSSITTLSFESTDITPLNTPIQMQIASIVLHKQRWPFFLVLWLGAGALLLLLWQKERFKRSKTLYVETISTTTTSVDVTPDIVLYIGSTYHNSQLSLAMVAHHVGISPKVVSQLLHQQFSLPFKQYLIAVRLQEAKRLLTESTLRITEIAYEIGFNYPTTFNRLFREREAMSPTEYRREHS